MPLLWLSRAFITGIIAADNVELPVTTWLILAGVSFGLTLVIFILQRIRVRRSFGAESPSPLFTLAPLLLLAIALGGLRYPASIPDLSDPNFIASHNDAGEHVTLTGVVDSFPDLRDNYLYLRIQQKISAPTANIWPGKGGSSDMSSARVFLLEADQGNPFWGAI